MPAVAIHPGQVFGNLTIIQEAPSSLRAKARTALCVCSCGRKTTTRIRRLVSGETTMCRNHPGRLEGIAVGTRFGKWVVIKSRARSSHVGVFALCRCDCGKEREVLASNLRLGKSRSCGCEETTARAAQRRAAIAVINERRRTQTPLMRRSPKRATRLSKKARRLLIAEAMKRLTIKNQSATLTHSTGEHP